MKAAGVNNGNWKGGYLSRYMRDVTDALTGPTPAPRPTERTPKQEVERLQGMIADEQALIETYPNYTRICNEARGRIEFYRRRIEEWNAAIYAADQEAANHAARMRANRAEFVARIAELNEGTD